MEDIRQDEQPRLFENVNREEALAKVKADLGVQAESNPVMQKAVGNVTIGQGEPQIYPSGTGATEGGAQEYDFYCPEHMQFVRGNICPVGGHKIDSRFFIDQDKRQLIKDIFIEKAVITDIDQRAANIRKSGPKPAYKEMPELGRREKIDLIKSELNASPFTTKKPIITAREHIYEDFQNKMVETIKTVNGIQKSLEPKHIKTISNLLAELKKTVDNAYERMDDDRPAIQIMDKSIHVLDGLFK